MIRPAAILVLLAAAACSRPPAATPPAVARSLLFVTIDTLRADHVGAYGAKNVATPMLDRIARDLDAELVPDAFAWVEPPRQVAHTANGEELLYDALIVAVMQSQGLTKIATNDGDFDRVPGIHRARL